MKNPWDDTEGKGAPPPDHTSPVFKSPDRGIEVILRCGVEDIALRLPEVPITGDIIAVQGGHVQVKLRQWLGGVPVLVCVSVPK